MLNGTLLYPLIMKVILVLTILKGHSPVCYKNYKKCLYSLSPEGKSEITKKMGTNSNQYRYK